MESIEFGDGQEVSKSLSSTPKLILTFGKFPAWTMKSGLWAAMTSTQKSVYACLVYFADNKTGWIKNRTCKDISKLAGVNTKAVGQTTNALHSIGAILKKASRNHAAYQVRVTPPTDIQETINFLSIELPRNTESRRRNRFTQRYEKHNADFQEPNT